MFKLLLLSLYIIISLKCHSNIWCNNYPRFLHWKDCSIFLVLNWWGLETEMKSLSWYISLNQLLKIRKKVCMNVIYEVLYILWSSKICNWFNIFVSVILRQHLFNNVLTGVTDRSKSCMFVVCFIIYNNDTAVMLTHSVLRMGKISQTQHFDILLFVQT